jgi:hypothetical protein
MNKMVEQDQRAVKRITTAMQGFKSFWIAQKMNAGYETIHMVKMGSCTAPMANPCPQPGSLKAMHFDFRRQLRTSMVGQPYCDKTKKG